jgi:hypothetical protein
MHPVPIPVICDRCRAAGAAGAEGFTDLGDLLAFPPVPRRIERVDGWTAEAQRHFIAALAITGSPRRAAEVVRRSVTGAEQLRKAAGAEGFSAAWDRAMALAQEKGQMRMNAGLNAAAAADGPPSGPGDDPGAVTADDLRQREEALQSILRKYVLKLAAEREARLEGRIVAADFYARQLTHIEVGLDLLSGGEGFRAFMDFRHDGMSLVRIAETPFSRLLDDARRDFWARAAEPERPRAAAHDLLVDHGLVSVGRSEGIYGGEKADMKAQEKAYRERHAADAAAQLAWEAAARRDFEERCKEDNAAQAPPRDRDEYHPSRGGTDEPA